MIHISGFIRSYASAFPEISRDKISEAAQSAIKQLPWVAGTLAVYSLNFYTSGMVTLLFPFAAFAASWRAGLISLSDLSEEEKTQKVLQILKISLTVFAVLALSVSLSRCQTVLTLFQQLLQQPLSSGSLLKIGSIYITLHIAKMIASQGLSIKELAQNEEWLRKSGTCYVNTIKNLANGALHKSWAELDQAGYVNFVPRLQKMLSQSVASELIEYLSENPENLERAKILFPTIFTYQEDFGKLVKILTSVATNKKYTAACKTIKDYFIQEFSPFVSSGNPHNILKAAEMASENQDQVQDQDPVQLHLAIRLSQDNLAKLKVLTNVPIAIALTPEQISSGNFLPEDNLGAQLKKIGDQRQELEGNIRQTLQSLQKIRKDWVEKHLKGKTTQHLDHIFDELGFTVGDYQALAQLVPNITDLSARRRVIHALYDRAVYCLEDLNDNNLICGDKAAVVQQLTRFIQGKPLEELPKVAVTPTSKVSRFAATFFNMSLTTLGLGLQFAGAPWITGFGAAYGFALRQGALNPVRNYRFPQTSLYFPQSLKQKVSDISSWIFSTVSAYQTQTKMGKSFAFFFAVSQGETLRDYTDQTV